ncbi:hypothetical protein CROQUDRAFT_55298, partial [Cronartium quercuum f. sp. fusiforme G11]
RQWMIHRNSEEVHKCYYKWQKLFRQEALQAKNQHWKEFLTHCSGNNIFKAAKYIKPNQTGDIAPLYHLYRTLASNKEEQASLLFHGNSVAHIEANLSDIPVPQPRR